MMMDPARLGEAVRFAAEAHAGQTRKGTGVPYVSHLLAVCGAVLENGGDAEQAVAGLLHDTLEDCEEVSREALAARFGERVAAIVAACSDTLPGDRPGQKSPWRVRKERYLAHLAQVGEDALLVAACDKLHNLRALLTDLRAEGLRALENFNAGPLDQVWFFENVVARLAGRVPLRLMLELQALVQELQMLVQGGDTRRYGAEGRER